MSENSILSRIQVISEQEGVSIAAIEREIGASNGVLSRAIKNGTDIQSKWIQLIAKRYPSYSKEWLLTGEGGMLQNSQLEYKKQETPPTTVPTESLIPSKSLIKQRILQLLEKEGISQYEFYKRTGITRGILSQDNGINESNMMRILAYYTNLNVNWLIKGEGAMFITEDKHPEQEKSDNFHLAIHTEKQNEGIPLIPIEAMAGIFTGENIINEYECDRYVVPAFKGADFLITVKGSSMYPKYSSGDIVACQRVPMSDLFFQWNKVYVIDTNQGALIKRINPGSDKDHVLIVSENKDYPPFELPYTSIHGVAIVVGVIRLE
jgi:phage repressor protein C with HTH and peptisase S24 domain